MQSNIELKRFTNFLKQGACVRRNGDWSLFAEVTETTTPSIKNTINTDFVTGHISRKHYKNQWDMTDLEFRRALDLVINESSISLEKIIISWSTVDSQIFARSFELAQDAFRAGRVKKVVPVCVQNGHLLKPLSVAQKALLLKRLSEVPELLFPYGEWTEDNGFMGATPEVLFHKTPNIVSTMALAGTSGKDVKPDVFLNDPKERKEHQFVIDDIVEVLKPLGTATVGKTKVIEFPALNHLQTQIEVKLNSQIATDQLISKLHPTPALGIYPRGDYFKTFVTYPLQSQRGGFGAPWGIESGDESLLLVSIRKWDWKGSDVQIFAGCGVVAESVLEKEFAEILKKIDSVKRIFFQE